MKTTDPQYMTSDDEMFESIKADLKERMKPYTDSRHPTADDVRIAWLVAEVDQLQEENKKLKKSLRNAMSVALDIKS